MKTLHLFSPFPCLSHFCSLSSEIFNKLSISIRRSFHLRSALPKILLFSVSRGCLRGAVPSPSGWPSTAQKSETRPRNNSSALDQITANLAIGPSTAKTSACLLELNGHVDRSRGPLSATTWNPKFIRINCDAMRHFQPAKQLHKMAFREPQFLPIFCQTQNSSFISENDLFNQKRG